MKRTTTDSMWFEIGFREGVAFATLLYASQEYAKACEDTVNEILHGTGEGGGFPGLDIDTVPNKEKL